MAAHRSHLCAAHPGLAGGDRGATRGNVLDIGCGAGELSLALAAARPQAQVRGLDVSADLVAAAQQRARQVWARSASSWAMPRLGLIRRIGPICWSRAMA
jgi:2-polyprenyl-3-methyl-5-hydroxy-6-metoxy-1,4-benzoquinol methylase